MFPLSLVSTCPVTCQMYQRRLLNLIKVATLVLFVFCPKYHLARLHMMFLRPLETLYNVTKSLLSNYAQNKIQLETVDDYIISLLIIICKCQKVFFFFSFLFCIISLFVLSQQINKQTHTYPLNVGILMQELVGFRLYFAHAKS